MFVTDVLLTNSANRTIVSRQDREADLHQDCGELNRTATDVPNVNYPYPTDDPRPVQTDVVTPTRRSTVSDEPATEAIIRALEDPQYDWRTIDGISADTGLPQNDVLQHIVGLADVVIESTIPDKKGRSLFTTRERYRTTHSGLKRLKNIFRAG